MKTCLASVILLLISGKTSLCSEFRNAQCFELYSTFIPQRTYSIVSASSSLECCTVCKCDPTCNAWSWNTERRLCGLKDGTTISSVGDDGYVSGLTERTEMDLSEEIEIPYAEIESEMSAAAESMESQSEASSFLTSTESVSVPGPPPACKGTKDQIYDVSSVIQVIADVSDAKCCEMCRKRSDCYSWNWFDDNCFLNSDVGPLIKRKNAICGSIA